VTHGTAATAGSAQIDVAAERARTPGAAGRHHFNAAGAALQTRETVDAVVHHLRLEETEGGYEAAARNRPLVETAYGNLARLLGALPDEIALFDSATSGMRGVIEALRLGAGTTVIVSRSTYVSQALHLMTLQRENGIDLVILPNTAAGCVDLEALELALIASTDAVICLAHIPTSSGVVEPVLEVGVLAKRHGALYILDATQSVGQVPVNVREIGCDVLVTTGRKFLRAPRGTGIAFINAELVARLAPSAPDVRAASWTSEDGWSVAPTARMLESWEHSVAARIGLGVAVGQAIDRGIDSTAAYLGALALELRTRLAAIDRVVVSDPPAATSAIVTFTVEGIADSVVCDYLKERNISTISIPAAHAQWDLGARGVPSVVRASVHVYNDAGDLDALVTAVTELVVAQESRP
jgi:selenocysteine lyase/cysteine desulfurase